MEVDYRDVLLLLGSYFGVICEHIAQTADGITVYISVPGESEFFDADGVKMCGMDLAKHFKSMMNAADKNPSRNLIVKTKTRDDGCWDATRAKASLIAMTITISLRRLAEGGMR